MVDPTRTLIGRDVRLFLDDEPLGVLQGPPVFDRSMQLQRAFVGDQEVRLPSAQPVIMGVDLAAEADMHAVHYVEWNGSAFVTAPPPLELPSADDLDDFDHLLDFLYGDGSGRVTGLMTRNYAPGEPATLPHPGHMTRQRRRAAARAASKGRTI